MYKNNFDDVFDNAFGDPEFKRFIQGYKRYLCVKWTLLAVLWAAVALPVLLFNSGGGLAFNIGFVVVYGIILIPIFLAFYPKYGSKGRTEEPLNGLLLKVLNGCFDEEIEISEINFSKADYEQSCPEQRCRNLETALFTADDTGITVKTPRAEINICGALVHEPNTTPASEIHNDTLMTGMIFAVARFSDNLGLNPDNDRIKGFLEQRTEKIFVSAYENTLYIEIDYRDISVKGMSRERLQKSCLNVCENIALILNIVDRV